MGLGSTIGKYALAATLGVGAGVGGTVVVDNTITGPQACDNMANRRVDFSACDLVEDGDTCEATLIGIRDQIESTCFLDRLPDEVVEAIQEME